MRRFGRLSGFVSEDAQRDYFAAYDATLVLAPVPVEPLDVETPFGTTRVLAAGPTDAPPLVVLHGGAASATMWLDLLPAFTATHRAHLLDGIGELGRSVVTRMMHGSADIVSWLEAVLAGLAIDRCALIGLSNDGFQAATFASARPKRVERVALLAPAAVFLPIRWSWVVAVLHDGSGRERPGQDRAVLAHPRPRIPRRCLAGAGCLDRAVRHRARRATLGVPRRLPPPAPR